VKYLGIICLVLIIALGAIGVSYASYQQDLVVEGDVRTGTWDLADYSSVDLSGAPNCTIESQSAREITFKVHFKCNNRKPYEGSIVFPIVNDGTIPVQIDSVNITVIGPDKRDPLAEDLIVAASGALDESNHMFIDSGSQEMAELTLSGNPDKEDYFVTVSFTTKIAAP
jgi:hypothetical protein